MNDAAAITHVGITVTSIDEYIDFYQKHFGFKLVRRGVFPESFIAAVPQLYKQQEGVYSDFAFLASPNGVVLELFQFSSTLPCDNPVWNKPGYHHICLKVDNVRETYKRMTAARVEFYFEPRPIEEVPGAYWVFLKDPDGNMIELQDTNL